MITYKGKEYPTRTLKLYSEENDLEMIYTIADEALFNDISKNDKYLEFGTDEFYVDQQIYYYVEEGCLDLPAEEIAKNHLDIEFKLIEEIL